MAAGVLLAVLLVTIMTYVLNTYRDTQKTILDAKVTESIAQYNEQFRAYEKAQMYGTDVLSCLNLAYSMNVENRVWDTSGISGTSRIISNNDSGIDERAITLWIYKWCRRNTCWYWERKSNTIRKDNRRYIR